MEDNSNTANKPVENNGAETVTTPPVNQQVDIDALLKAARKEEKDKVYGEVTNLKTKLAEKVTLVNDYIIKLAESDKKIKELEGENLTLKTEGDNKVGEKSKELQDTIAELTAKLAQAEADKLALENTYKLKEFTATAIKEANLDTSVASLVAGDSEEAIKASIEKAKTIYETIKSSIVPPTTPPVTPPSNVVPPVTAPGMVQNIYAPGVNPTVNPNDPLASLISPNFVGAARPSLAGAMPGVDLGGSPAGGAVDGKETFLNTVGGLSFKDMRNPETKKLFAQLGL